MFRHFKIFVVTFNVDMDKNNYKNYLLVVWREEAGQTQQDVADAINVDRQTVYRAENGKSASFKLLRNLCLHYNKSLADLLDLKAVA